MYRKDALIAFARVFLLSALAAGVWSGPSIAAGNGACGRYGRFAPLRQVSGEIVAAENGWWGGRHVIVQDVLSGCRTFVLTEDANCTPGRRFEAFGRLKSFKGEDYEATFLFFRGPVAACRIPAG